MGNERGWLDGGKRMTEITMGTFILGVTVMYAIFLFGEFGAALIGFVKGILTKKSSNRKGNSYDDKVNDSDTEENGGEE